MESGTNVDLNRLVMIFVEWMLEVCDNLPCSSHCPFVTQAAPQFNLFTNDLTGVRWVRRMLVAYSLRAAPFPH